MIYSDTITLLDRTATNRTPSTDLPDSITGGSGNGDLKPYRIRLTMTNCGIDKINDIKRTLENYVLTMECRNCGNC